MSDSDVEEMHNENDLNPRPNQGQRIIMQLFDSFLSNNILFTNPLFEEISLQALECDDAMSKRLNFKHIDLLILRIIISSQLIANVYSRKKGQTNQNQMKFSRLILCKVVSHKIPEENSRVVYLMEARNQNKNLWNKNVNHRDNGAISIGSIIRLPCPMPIDAYMRCDIPLVISHQPAILMKTPRALENVRMSNEIEANTSLAFLCNNSQVTVDFTADFKTTCSGNFYDRQRISDWNGIKGCGCYGMSPNSTSLAIQHAITITANCETFRMDDFSSQRFSNIYLSNAIPGSVKLHMLQLTDAYVLLLDKITECIDYVNANGGFTVIGWYKRGLINDKSLLAARVGTIGSSSTGQNNNSVDEEAQVDAGEISYHIVHIIPTNRDLLDETTVKGSILKSKKFDVSVIENSTIV